MPQYNPNYTPTGRNTKVNPYYKRINHRRLAKNVASKTMFSLPSGFTADFSGPDGPLPDPWFNVNPDAPVVIENNQAVPGPGSPVGQAYYTALIDYGTPNVEIIMDVSADAGNSSGVVCGPVLRASANGPTMFVAGYRTSDSTWNIAFVDDAGQTILESIPATVDISAGVTVYAASYNDRIELQVEGQILSVTTTDLSDHTHAGFRLRSTVADWAVSSYTSNITTDYMSLIVPTPVPILDDEPAPPTPLAPPTTVFLTNEEAETWLDQFTSSTGQGTPLDWSQSSTLEEKHATALQLWNDYIT